MFLPYFDVLDPDIKLMLMAGGRGSSFSVN